MHDAKSHLDLVKASGASVGLIEIAHTLENPDYSDFDIVYSFRRFEYKNFIRSWLGAISIYNLLRVRLRITDQDVLFIYTEFEPFNNLIALQFKKCKSRVYLIEDGGFATYLPFCGDVEERLSLKEKLREVIIRLCPGLAKLRFKKQNGDILPWLSDQYFDGVCLYRELSINRDIQIINLKLGASSHLNCIPNSALFLNEDLYVRDQSMVDYINGLRSLLKALFSGFNTVYFKYHPRESNLLRAHIQKKVLSQFPGLVIIEDNSSIEEIIDKYNPEVVASYFSAALLSLYERGVQPLYMYHLVPDLREKKYFQLVSLILDQWGYTFASDFSSVKSGYKSNLKFRSLDCEEKSLLDIINNA